MAQMHLTSLIWRVQRPSSRPGSIEPLLQAGDRVLDQLGGLLALGLGSDDALGGGDSKIGGGGADVLDRLGLGLGDPVIGHAGATLHHVGKLLARVGRIGLGIGAGAPNDLLGFLAGLAALRLIFREQHLSLLAQPTGLVEVLADALGAAVEHAGHRARQLGAEHQEQEQKKGDQCPEGGVHQRACSRWARIAALTSAGPGVRPIRRLTMSPTTAVVMPSTSPIALLRVSAISRSAAAILATIASSTRLRSASTSAV